MGCSSCKKNSIKVGGTNLSSNGSKNSIGVKILIFIVKIILFLITSVILTIIVIPFSVYMLAKVFFYDGTVDVESLIVGLNNMIRNRKERKEGRKDEESEGDDEEYEYEYTDIDEIKED